MTITLFYISAWTLLGIINLVCGETVSKGQYALTWIMLIFTLIRMYVGE